MSSASPLFIKHRCNQIEQLQDVETSWGVEIDLRSHSRDPGAIHLTHDPWTQGQSFSTWLEEWKGHTGPILLNTKEDGLESQAIKTLEDIGIENYLFLDTALPTLVKHCKEGRGHRFMMRFSKYEPIEFVRCFRGQVKWIWADCFDGTPPNLKDLTELKKEFQICLVSPELHGYPLPGNLPNFLEGAKVSDAICTKSPADWVKKCF